MQSASRRVSGGHGKEERPDVFNKFAQNTGQEAIPTTTVTEAAPSCERSMQELAQAAPGMQRAYIAEQRAERLQAQLDNERALVTVLAERLTSREDLLRAVYFSRSWRFTGPLRALATLLRRFGAMRDVAHISHVPALNMGPEQPTIFIECTHTFHTELNTGIQRVVRNVLRHAKAVAAEHGYAVVPVMLEKGHFVSADIDVVLSNKQQIRSDSASLADAPAIGKADDESAPLRKIRIMLRPARRGFLSAAASLFSFAPARWFSHAPAGQFILDHRPSCAADILLLLDSSWTIPIWPAVERFKRRGGRIAGVVFDIIPVSHSYTCVPELALAFKAWLDEHARNTDAFVAISQSTARYLNDYLHSELYSREVSTHAPISHFYLGSELDFAVDAEDVRPVVKAIFDKPEHVILMVGSIEPRKNHAFVLDAFERLWKTGERVSLVIVGRQSWKTKDFLDRVAQHQQLGQQLFCLRDATDSELDFAYRSASALVIASDIEGFGLPVVEAFQRGLPVLCSDISVFREIADGIAIFFGLDDPDQLTTTLLGYCRTHSPAARRERTPQSWLTWRESTEQLFAALLTALNGNVNMIASLADQSRPPISSGWPEGSDSNAQPAYARR